MSLHSIESFILHLATMAESVVLAEHRGLEVAAKVVEKEAKSEFGVYQGQIGSFAKWDELAESTKEDRTAKGFSENDPLLRSGKLRDSISHRVEHLTAVIGSDSDIMVWQELGTDKIPPRAVLGPALLRREHQVVKILGEHTVHGLLGGSAFSHFQGIEHDPGA